MRYLLDTHTLLWALGDSGELSPTARDAIASPANIVFVSSASMWECAIKASIGKLDLPDDFFDSIPATGYEAMPIRISHRNVSLPTDAPSRPLRPDIRGPGASRGRDSDLARSGNRQVRCRAAELLNRFRSTRGSGTMEVRRYSVDMLATATRNS